MSYADRLDKDNIYYAIGSALLSVSSVVFVPCFPSPLGVCAA